jgi:hypothetical protein
LKPIAIATALALLGGCAPAAAPCVSPASPPPGGDASCAHDPAIEGEVAAAIEQRAQSFKTEADVRFETAFECPRLAAPRTMVGLRSHGHGGAIELLSATADAADHVDLRSVTLVGRDGEPTLDGPPPTVLYARASVGGDRARHALAFARAALAARVARIAPPPGEKVGVGGLSMSSDDEEVELRTRGFRAQDLARQWQGYVGSETVAEQLPIELAFTALTSLLPTAAPSGAEDADRELLDDAWTSPFPHDFWIAERLLDLGSVLGGENARHRAFAALRSPRETERVVAARGMAAITKHDFIHDAHGAVRPLAAVVADYEERGPR